MLSSTCGKAKNLQPVQARRKPRAIGRTTCAKPVPWIYECFVTGGACQSVVRFGKPIPCGCILMQCCFRNGRIGTVFHNENSSHVGLMKAAPFVSFPQAVALAATFFDERRRLLEQVSDDQFQDAHNILQRVEAQRLCHFLDKRSE
jgi:hypothetical protein